MLLPVALDRLEKLPIKALAIWSPASTWNAEVLDVNANCLVPSVFVNTEAEMPASLKAVAACDVPFPAPWMPALMAVTRVSRLVTLARLTDTCTLLLSEKPGPAKLKVVAPEVPLADCALIFATVVSPAPSPISTLPALTWKPFNPKLCESTVDLDRSTPTKLLAVAATPESATPPLPLPAPRYTCRLLAKVPPVFNPMDCAWRSISARSVWNSPFRVARLPVNVPEADCVASVFSRSRIDEMLLIPPSMICN